MAKENKIINYGQYAFLGGLVIAIVVGLASNMLGTALPLAMAVLGVLGVIVGLMNISDKEIMPFLVAAIALIVATVAVKDTVANIGVIMGPLFQPVELAINNLFGAVSVFVAMAAFIVAILQIYKLARPS